MAWGSESQRPTLLRVLPEEATLLAALEENTAFVLTIVVYLQAGHVGNLPCVHPPPVLGQYFTNAVRALFAVPGDLYFVFPEVVR